MQSYPVKLTARQARLVSDAREAGYTVFVTLHTVTMCTYTKRGAVRRGLVLYGCGTAYDLTVAPSHARGLRSFVDMRAILRLPE